MNQESVNSSTASKGFTKTSHVLLNWLLLGKLKPLDIKLVLLVLRLTVGCHREWAELRQADLTAIGVRASHAKEVIDSALAKKVIIRDGTSNRYKIGSYVAENDEAASRLSYLIGKHISRNGKTKVTKKVTSDLLNEELSSYQNSNTDKLPKKDIFSDEEFFELLAKDKFINSLKDTDKHTSIAGGHDLDVATFIPRNREETAALEVWQQLEPDKPNSFGLYVHLVKLGLPADEFYSIASEVRQDSRVMNKGALFNSKAMDYCRGLLAERMDANG